MPPATPPAGRPIVGLTARSSLWFRRLDLSLDALRRLFAVRRVVRRFQHFQAFLPDLEGDVRVLKEEGTGRRDEWMEDVLAILPTARRTLTPVALANRQVRPDFL